MKDHHFDHVRCVLSTLVGGRLGKVSVLQSLLIPFFFRDL